MLLLCCLNYFNLGVVKSSYLELVQANGMFLEFIRAGYSYYRALAWQSKNMAPSAVSPNSSSREMESLRHRKENIL